MNKNVKKPSNNTYGEDKGKRLESKLKEKKDVIRTNRIYNKVLKELEVDDLEVIDDLEYELFESRAKGKK